MKPIISKSKKSEKNSLEKKHTLHYFFTIQNRNHSVASNNDRSETLNDCQLSPEKYFPGKTKLLENSVLSNHYDTEIIEVLPSFQTSKESEEFIDLSSQECKTIVVEENLVPLMVDEQMSQNLNLDLKKQKKKVVHPFFKKTRGIQEKKFKNSTVVFTEMPNNKEDFTESTESVLTRRLSLDSEKTGTDTRFEKLKKDENTDAIVAKFNRNKKISPVFLKKKVSLDTKVECNIEMDNATLKNNTKWAHIEEISWPKYFNIHVRQLKNQVIKDCKPPQQYLPIDKSYVSTLQQGDTENFFRILATKKHSESDSASRLLGRSAPFEIDIIRFMDGVTSGSEKMHQLLDHLNEIKESSNTSHTLFTERYRPKCPNSIVGNLNEVDRIMTWLNQWNVSNEPCQPNAVSTVSGKKRKKGKLDASELLDLIDEDNPWGYLQAQATTSDLFPGVLLVSGPEGCGKTSAIYTCAKSSGYHVVEMNSGVSRSGKDLVAMIGEATQSHRLISDCHDSEDKSCTNSLILIEEVDTILEEEKGFWAALDTLARNTKRPIILTCNDYRVYPITEMNFERIDFCYPKIEEITLYLFLVCIVEGCVVIPSTLRTLAEHFHCDLRKILNHLNWQLHFLSGQASMIKREEFKIANANEVFLNLDSPIWWDDFCALVKRCKPFLLDLDLMPKIEDSKKHKSDRENKLVLEQLNLYELNSDFISKRWTCKSLSEIECCDFDDFSPCNDQRKFEIRTSHSLYRRPFLPFVSPEFIYCASRLSTFENISYFQLICRENGIQKRKRTYNPYINLLDPLDVSIINRNYFNDNTFFLL